MDYKIAIPSYKRQVKLKTHTLKLLQDNNIDKSNIYIFVANDEEYNNYTSIIDNDYNIIIGELGITNQRNFIRNYFNEGDKIVSMDDDIKQLIELNDNKLITKNNLNDFFNQSFQLLKNNNCYIWGVYPIKNSYFMKKNVNEISFDFKFIIGVIHGFIVRKDTDLYLNPQAESKEDILQSILYYLKDKKVMRYNHITFKTQFLAEGGLGKDRFLLNKNASYYIKDKFPDIASIYQRNNGMYEIRLTKLIKI